MSVVKSEENHVLKSDISKNLGRKHSHNLPLPPFQKKKSNSSKESLEKRAIRNRQFSKETRIRVKAYESELKATLQILKDENKFLLASIAELEALRKRPNTSSLDAVFSSDEFYMEEAHDSIPSLSHFSGQDIMQLSSGFVGMGCASSDSHTTNTTSDNSDNSITSDGISVASSVHGLKPDAFLCKSCAEAMQNIWDL